MEPLTEYELAVLGALRMADQPATSVQVAKIIGKHHTAVGQALHRLKEKGRIKRYQAELVDGKIIPPRWEII